MTNVNMDFTNDVCYEGMFTLTDSIKQGKPTGLKFWVIGQRFTKD
jgi:hypothetical protein